MTSEIIDLVSRERLTRLEATQGQPSPPALPKGGGGSTFDGMEARVAKLEAHMEHVRDNTAKLSTDTGTIRKELGQVAVDLGALKSKVEQLPGKTWVGVAVAAQLAAILALLTILGRLGILTAP